MTIDELVKASGKWSGELSIQEVQMYKDNPGLCLIKRTCLNEKMPSNHIKEISRLDFQEGVVSYINTWGTTKTRKLDRNFFEDYLIFNADPVDYRFGIEKVTDSAIKRDEIKERADRLWKLYFSHLIEDSELRRKAKVKSRFSPRFTRGLAIGVFAVMALAANTIYNRGYNPDKFEQEELFPEIHAKYREIKRENLERLAKELIEVSRELFDAESKYKAGPQGFKRDDTIHILSSLEDEYEYARHTRDFKHYKYGQYSSYSRYSYVQLFPAVVKYIVDNNIKGDSWSEDHWHFMIPGSVIRDRYPRREPYRVVLSPEVMKVVNEFKQRRENLVKAQLKRQEIDEDVELFQRVEPHYKIDFDRLYREAILGL